MPSKSGGDSEKSREAYVFSLLSESKWIATSHLAELANGSRESVSNILAKLLTGKRVERRGNGRRWSPYEWRRLPIKRLMVTVKAKCFVEAVSSLEAAQKVHLALSSGNIHDFKAEYDVNPCSVKNWLAGEKRK